MKEMINKIGETLVIKMRILNDETFENYPNKRNHPIQSEFTGMLQLLKTMDFDFEIDYNEDVTKMTGITIMSTRFEV